MKNVNAIAMKNTANRNTLFFHLSKFKSYSGTSKKDTTFWLKKSVGLVRAYCVQKAEKPGWLFIYGQILLCFYRGLHHSLSSVLQILLGKLQEWKVTDRRKVKFISKAWLKPQTNKHARTDLWHLPETWCLVFILPLVVCLVEASTKHLRCCNLFHFSIILNILVFMLI